MLGLEKCLSVVLDKKISLPGKSFFHSHSLDGKGLEAGLHVCSGVSLSFCAGGQWGFTAGYF